MSTIQTVTNWSVQQQAIFEFFRTAEGNLIVRARAGTGKTTTIVQAIRYAPERRKLLMAFNKRIQLELGSRIMDIPEATASTAHSVGFAAVRSAWPGVGMEAKTGARADALALAVCGASTPEPILRLVSKLHTKGREMAPHARTLGELTAIAHQFECEPEAAWEAGGWDLKFVETKALAAMELAATVKPVQTGIDYADQLFLPVRNRWLVPQYDLVVVDEAQDMTVTQLEIAQGVCKGRIVMVGDDRQAIYGFRGADSGSLDRLKAELGASELGLTTTYRCGKKIVELAAQLVPDFTAGPDNPEGQIHHVSTEQLEKLVEHGDFVLSRLNAPLVSIAMSLLRQGRRARIAGRDIGAGLKALVRKLAKGRAANSIPMFLAATRAWEEREVLRWTKAEMEAKVDLVRDQAAMLIDLAQSADSVQHVMERIEALFTDDGLGQAGVITCSSVHKAKGLEANRVFVLMDTLYRRGRDQEEENIEYVAITRAKQELFLVRAPKQV